MAAADGLTEAGRIALTVESAEARQQLGAAWLPAGAPGRVVAQDDDKARAVAVVRRTVLGARPFTKLRNHGGGLAAL